MMKPVYKWLIAIATTLVALLLVVLFNDLLPVPSRMLMSVMLVISPGIIVWYALDEFCDPEKVSP